MAGPPKEMEEDGAGRMRWLHARQRPEATVNWIGFFIVCTLYLTRNIIVYLLATGSSCITGLQLLSPPTMATEYRVVS
uniref:Uncharacterized protein n=1 Tax=Arundo donax TaxID=35708 RepID=A0A0A9EYR2_ARUDO